MIIKILFGIFISILIFFGVIAKKYDNPYKLVLFVGDKGSGKSTISIAWMLNHYKKGWNIYCDAHISGIDHVQVDPHILDKYRPLKKSFLCVDEAGITFDNRRYKDNWNAGLTEFFKLQRHYFTKVLILSQDMDVDKKLRALCDQIYYVTNISNFIGILIPLKKKIKGNSDTNNDAQDNPIIKQYEMLKIWHWKFYFLPKYFKYFNSYDAPDRPLESVISQANINNNLH